MHMCRRLELHTGGVGTPPMCRRAGLHTGGGVPLHTRGGTPPGEGGVHKDFAQLGVTPPSCALLKVGGSPDLDSPFYTSRQKKVNHFLLFVLAQILKIGPFKKSIFLIKSAPETHIDR